MLSAPPVPRIPRHVPRRHRSERMTIAAGFRCTDGIVLASDTLYTGVNKRYDRKLWDLPPTNGADVIIGGSGNAVLIRRARDDVTERLAKAQSLLDQRSIRDIIDGVLYSLLHKHQPATDDFPLSLVVGIRTADGCALYESDGNAVLGPVDRAATCIGWGAGVGSYVADSLYTIRMSVKWASIVGAHLIRIAKQYAADCGGDTHILTLPLIGEPIFEDNQETIASLENYLSAVEDAMRFALPSGEADETTEHRLTTLNAAIRHVHARIYRLGLTRISGRRRGRFLLECRDTTDA